VPTATGVYDGLQGAPRYFIVKGEYQGLNLLVRIGWACVVQRRAVIGLDLRPDPIQVKYGQVGHLVAQQG
jgi:hypothetical protein